VRLERYRELTVEKTAETEAWTGTTNATGDRIS
jgi:hypothetical protein